MISIILKIIHLIQYCIIFHHFKTTEERHFSLKEMKRVELKMVKYYFI